VQTEHRFTLTVHEIEPKKQHKARASQNAEQ
jgi:hypothetical protein